MNVNIYLPDFVKQKLDEEVKKNGGSRSGTITQILTNHWAETDETKNLIIKIDHISSDTLGDIIREIHKPIKIG